jgi:hypothetical protein
MRPLPGDDAFQGRPSRTTSFTDTSTDPTPLARMNQPPQMTYFLTNENGIGDSQPVSPGPAPKQQKSAQSSTYGVESLETVISSLSQDSDDQTGTVRRARRNWKRNLGVVAGSPEDDMSEPTSPISNDLSRNASPSHHRRSSQATLSRPFTPLSFGSPAPAGSPYSRRTSDAGSCTDDNTSQAIVSSGDEDREVTSELIDSGSAPQLVMPTMKMPSRRPFTERGKNMGRLKVLIAGDSGTFSRAG